MVSPLILRNRHRRQQRGAAVFIVVMVLTIVSAIGVFSMRSASLVDLATGYNRQSVQAAFQAEYGARAAATYLQMDPALVTSTARVTGCARVLQLYDLDAPCNVLKTSFLANALNDSAPAPLDDALPGMLALPVADEETSILSEFVAELTEPAPANVTASPGFVAGHFKQITITSIARVYPTDGSSTDVCSPASRGTVSQQSVRAHAIVPL